MARKPTDDVQLKLRFSEDLRRKIERAAAKANRSMNAEIIHRLHYSFAAEHNAATQEDIIRDLDKRYWRAHDRAVELENMLTNIRADMRHAVREALVDAGLLKGSASE